MTKMEQLGQMSPQKWKFFKISSEPRSWGSRRVDQNLGEAMGLWAYGGGEGGEGEGDVSP